MAIIPNVDFVNGAVLTAAQLNRFPRGVMGLQTLTTAFQTIATHTTFQDNGMTLTFTEVSGRLYRITAFSNLYPIGGIQGVNIRILRAAVALKQGNFATNVMNATTALPLQLSYTYTAVTNGAATFKVQIAAATNNTAVNDFGDATFPRQFIIEDIGIA